MSDEQDTYFRKTSCPECKSFVTSLLIETQYTIPSGWDYYKNDTRGYCLKLKTSWNMADSVGRPKPLRQSCEYFKHRWAEEDLWVCVDTEKDVWLSPSTRKYVGRGNPKKYRAYYCNVCSFEIPAADVCRLPGRQGNCPDCASIDTYMRECSIHGELKLPRGKRHITEFATCDQFISRSRTYGHYDEGGRFHYVLFTTKHPTCEVYGCPMCGAPADPALFGYCCNQHREAMMKRLVAAALRVDEVEVSKL